MSDEIKADSFSEYHQRHVRTTFQYIDKLLSEAEHTMADAVIAVSVSDAFGRHDADPAQGDARLHHANPARDGGTGNFAV